MLARILCSFELNIQNRYLDRLDSSCNVRKFLLPRIIDVSITHTQIFPVTAICGHLCGLLMTATTAIFTRAHQSDAIVSEIVYKLTPEAVLIGLAFNFGRSAALSPSGTAAIISTSRGFPCNLCLFETR